MSTDGYSTGLQKRMKTVLEERGVDTRGHNAEKMKNALRQFQASYTNTYNNNYD